MVLNISSWWELRWEHLNNPKDYITTCVHNVSRFTDDFKSKLEQATNIQYGIGYWKAIPEAAKMQYLVAGSLPAYSSFIDQENKYSEIFWWCTTAIIIWKDRGTEKNISIMTHQHVMFDLPVETVLLRNNTFSQNFTKILREIKASSIPWTIDVILLGGHIWKSYSAYESTISHVNTAIYEVLGFNACVAVWPTIYNKEGKVSKDIYLDTQNRQVHLFKEHKAIESNISLVASEVYTIIPPLLDSIKFTWKQELRKFGRFIWLKK